MDVLSFEYDRSFVLEALRQGDVDYLEHVSEAAEADLFRHLIRRQVIQRLAESYPTPRKKQEVPVWIYLSSELTLKLHGAQGYHAFVHGLDHRIDEFIEDRALMPPAGNHARRDHKEEVQFAIDVDQAHQLIAAVLLIPLVTEIHLVGFHGVVVFIEPEQIGLLVALVIGDEQIGSIADEKSLGVEQTQRP